MRLHEELKKISMLFALVLAMGIAMLTTVPAQAATTKVTYEVKYVQTAARAMLQQVNEFRTGSNAWYWDSTDTEKVYANGLSELQYDYDLEKVAMLRCAEIAYSYEHRRPDGSSCFSAYGELGYSYSGAGENIAAGYMSADSVFVGWREDNESYSGQGHRRNMLGARYNRIGIAGCYVNGTYYWVQEFAYNTASNTVTAANDSQTKVSITVDTDELVTTISTDPSSITVEVGEQITLPKVTTRVRGSNLWAQYGGSRIGLIANGTASWTSSNSSVAAVSGAKVTGVAEGTTTLKVKVYNGTQTVNVTVKPHTHQTVSTITKATLTKKGKITYTCSVCGEVTKTTTIGYPETFKLSTSTYVYDGTQKNPTVTITNCYGSTISSKYYTVTKQTGRTDVGSYTYTIKFKERYTGTKTLTFKIKPRNGSISSLTVGTGKVTLKAYRPVAETGGAYYQIAYRVKGTETWTYVTTYLQKKTISDLKSGKTYEFKERAYKTVDGTKYYGNWSAVKTCTVK